MHNETKKKQRKPRGLRRAAWVITQAFRTFLRGIRKFRLVSLTFNYPKVPIPRKNRAIIACNHPSIIDPVYLWGCLHRNAMAVAKAELWKFKPFGWLLSALGFIPILRGDPDSAQKSIESAVHVLENDGAIVIFPEGGCTKKDGRIRKFKHGVITMSIRTGAPIWPVGIVGSNRVAPLGKKFLRFWRKVQLNFGTPIDPRDYEGPDQAERMMAELRRQILALVGQEDALLEEVAA